VYLKKISHSYGARKVREPGVALSLTLRPLFRGLAHAMKRTRICLALALRKFHVQLGKIALTTQFRLVRCFRQSQAGCLADRIVSMIGASRCHVSPQRSSALARQSVQINHYGPVGPRSDRFYMPALALLLFRIPAAKPRGILRNVALCIVSRALAGGC
jgi:hypothetical protein